MQSVCRQPEKPFGLHLGAAGWECGKGDQREEGLGKALGMLFRWERPDVEAGMPGLLGWEKELPGWRRKKRHLNSRGEAGGQGRLVGATTAPYTRALGTAWGRGRVCSHFIKEKMG